MNYPVYNNNYPDRGNVYFCNVSSLKEFVLLKGIVNKIWYDSINKNKVARIYIKEILYDTNKKAYFKVGGITNIDIPWQLQYTLENSRRVAIMGIFKGPNSFYKFGPPWE
jgi:hypothetical protein